MSRNVLSNFSETYRDNFVLNVTHKEEQLKRSLLQRLYLRGGIHSSELFLVLALLGCPAGCSGIKDSLAVLINLQLHYANLKEIHS